MYQLQQTEVFGKWLSDLRDMRAKARILARLESARLGNLGDARSVGGAVSEMRVDVGAGYRVYFTRPPNGRDRLTLWRRQVNPEQRHCPRQTDGASN